MKKKKNNKKIDHQEDSKIQDVLSEIKKRFGEESIMNLGEGWKKDIGVISTGITSLDIALGVGGLPKGRVVEIFGVESTGKTTLALHVLAEAQKLGGIGAFIDAEHALDPKYSHKIGVDLKKLIISQPSSGEEALQITESLVRSGEVDIIVIDSVAALTPRREIEGEMGEQQIGLQARLMSHACRKLSGIVSQSDTIIIFLNQIRMKIGVRFGNPETTPGGLALKFYSSIRINLRHRAALRHKEEIIGSRIMAKVVKNKVAAPFKTAEFDIYYSQGIARNADLVALGVSRGLVKQSGSWFEYKGEKIGQGLNGTEKYLREHPKTAKAIREEIINNVEEEEK
jgi:recombination protein RecA